MCTQSAATYPSSTPSVADGTSLTGLIRRWLNGVEQIRSVLRRRRELRHLIDLNDRLLADLGITREQVDTARKIYWI